MRLITSALREFWRFMSPPKVDLLSPFDQRECFRRFVVAAEDRWAGFKGRAVLCEVGNYCVWLSKPTLAPNPFRNRMRVCVKPQDVGVRLECQAGMTGFTAFFVLAILLVLGLYLPLTLAISLRDPSTWRMFLTGVNLAAIFLPLIILGRWFARAEPSYLLSFVLTTLNAEVVGQTAE